MQIRLRKYQQHRIKEHGIDIEYVIVEQTPAEEYGDRKPHERAVKRRLFDEQHDRPYPIGEVCGECGGASGAEQFKNRVVQVPGEQPPCPGLERNCGEARAENRRAQEQVPPLAPEIEPTVVIESVRAEPRQECEDLLAESEERHRRKDECERKHKTVHPPVLAREAQNHTAREECPRPDEE